MFYLCIRNQKKLDIKHLKVMATINEINWAINKHFKSNNRNWIAKASDVPHFIIIEKDTRFPNQPLASHVALFILRNNPEIKYVLAPQVGMAYTRDTLRRAGYKIK